MNDMERYDWLDDSEQAQLKDYNCFRVYVPYYEIEKEIKKSKRSYFGSIMSIWSIFFSLLLVTLYPFFLGRTTTTNAKIILGIMIAINGLFLFMTVSRMKDLNNYNKNIPQIIKINNDCLYIDDRCILFQDINSIEIHRLGGKREQELSMKISLKNENVLCYLGSNEVWELDASDYENLVDELDRRAEGNYRLKLLNK